MQKRCKILGTIMCGMIVLCLLSLTSIHVIPCDNLFAKCKKLTNENIEVFITIMEPVGKYAKHTIDYSDGNAYITAYCYDSSWLRRGKGDFVAFINKDEHNVKKVFLIDDRGKSIEVPIDLE